MGKWIKTCCFFSRDNSSLHTHARYYPNKNTSPLLGKALLAVVYVDHDTPHAPVLYTCIHVCLRFTTSREEPLRVRWSDRPVQRIGFIYNLLNLRVNLERERRVVVPLSKDMMYKLR